MSHEITERDALFTVREPAWHGIGTVFEDYPTRQEAQKLVHPWEPIREPLYRREPVIAEDGTFSEDFIEIESHVMNTRSDNGFPLGVVSNTYQRITNDELWDIAEQLQEGASDVKFETGGSLKGGAKVWLLLRLEEPLAVPGDPRGETIPYYALQNAHDGTGAFRGQATMTRIVCDNTSQMADLDARARGTEFVFKHTTNIRDRIEEARQALSGWRSSIEQWTQFSLYMAGETISRDAADTFVRQFIPEPAAEIVSDRVRENIHEARRKWWDVFDGITCEGVNRTALGLVHASVEYSQHYRKAKNAESAFKRAYLDRSQITSKAVELAQEVVNA